MNDILFPLAVGEVLKFPLFPNFSSVEKGVSCFSAPYFLFYNLEVETLGDCHSIQIGTETGAKVHHHSVALCGTLCIQLTNEI